MNEPSGKLDTSPQPPVLGRPRSATAHQAMVNAAHDIVTKDGPLALTVQAICQAAGTSRASFYRRWSNAWQCFTESVDSFLLPPSMNDPTADTIDILVAATMNFYRYLSLRATKVRFGMILLDASAQPDMLVEAKKDTEARRAKLLKRIGDDVADGRIVVTIHHGVVVNIISGLALQAALMGRPLPEKDVRAVLSRLIFPIDATA